MNGSVDQRVSELGLILPRTLVPPTGAVLAFPAVRVIDGVAYVSGHGPQTPEGPLHPLRGRVGAEVTVAEARAAARMTALSIIGDLQRTLGTLDRVRGWGHVLGMVHAAPGFTDHPRVINAFSDVVISVFGLEVGAHARTAVGVASLPFGGIPVEVEAVVHVVP